VSARAQLRAIGNSRERLVEKTLGDCHAVAAEPALYGLLTSVPMAGM
jgi:hypothetical protein